MQNRHSARTLMSLARLMIRQAKTLRAEGMFSEARDLLRLSTTYRALSWSLQERPPVPIALAAAR